MLVEETLILELRAIDRLTTEAIAVRDVPSLRHKSWDNPVEDGVFEVEGFAHGTGSLLACAQGSEVLGRLGDLISEQLELYLTDGFGGCYDVEKHLGVFCHKLLINREGWMERIYEVDNLWDFICLEGIEFCI